MGHFTRVTSGQWLTSPFTEDVSEATTDDGTVIERCELRDDAGVFVRYEGRKGEALPLAWQREDAGKVLADAARRRP